jgi:hypothetical protein
MVAHLGGQRLVADVGPDDFEELRAKMAKPWRLHGVATATQYPRRVFKDAFEAGLIDRPVRFCPGFARPSKKTFRQEPARKGP